jgi:hypothetical protein
VRTPKHKAMTIKIKNYGYLKEKTLIEKTLRNDYGNIIYRFFIIQLSHNTKVVVSFNF